MAVCQRPGGVHLIAAQDGALPAAATILLAARGAWLVPGVGALSLALGWLATSTVEAQDRVRSAARINRWIILGGLMMLGGGAAMGGAWARVAWGESWLSEPKVRWTLLILGIYLVPLLGRRPDASLAAAVACFAVVLASWCGGNPIIGAGRHDFGWALESGRNLAILGAVVLPSVAGAAYWRRSRAGPDMAPKG